MNKINVRYFCENKLTLQQNTETQFIIYKEQLE